MFSTYSFCKEYKPDTSELAIRGKKFSFYVPGSLEKFIDPDDLLNGFPLWSKIWEASLILADYIAGIHAEPEKNFLEIGSGIGAVGITAAAFGHRLTITEYDHHALEFLRANAEINPCPNPPEIIRLDWNNPSITQSFDYIIGSEVVYNEEFFQPLYSLLKMYLKPEGEIIMTMEMRQTSMKFLEFMDGFYDIKTQKKILRMKDKDVRIILCKMKSKK